MEHKIKVKIADRIYHQTVHSEDEEEAMRKAAVALNGKISSLSSRFPNASMIDILTIIAYNESIAAFELEKKLQENEKGYDQLSADLQNYVDSLK